MVEKSKLINLSFIRDIVRKKAVMALHGFYSKNPSAIPDVMDHAKKAFCDKDPGVMSASLHVFHELIKVILHCLRMMRGFLLLNI